MNGFRTHLYILYNYLLCVPVSVSLDDAMNLNYLVDNGFYYLLLFVAWTLAAGRSRCRNLYEHKGGAAYFL